MKLENQVCSHGSGERLRELGVPQDSLWWWVKFKNSTDLLSERSKREAMYFNNLKRYLPSYSAFTVAELGEMLKKFKGKKSLNVNLKGCFLHSEWIPSGLGYKRIPEHTIIRTNEAENRAKMLIYILENKIIKKETLSL